MKWLSPLQKLKPQTRFCKICFKEISKDTLYSLLHYDVDVCNNCFQEIKPVFKHFEVNGYDALTIYNYDEKIQSLLYQFKGCFDIELVKVFIERYSREISLRYFNYILVPIPSYEGDDIIREFNHVEEMFKILNLPMLKAIKKTKKIKQANSTSVQRHNIKQFLELVQGVNLFDKKVLLVDDVYTTGSTMKACISLIEKLHPKTIKILVMSKTEMK